MLDLLVDLPATTRKPDGFIAVEGVVRTDGWMPTKGLHANMPDDYLVQEIRTLLAVFAHRREHPVTAAHRALDKATGLSDDERALLAEVVEKAARTS